MKEKVEQIKTEVLNKLSNIKDLKELDSIRLEYLSKKGKIILFVITVISVLLMSAFIIFFILLLNF